MLTIYLSSDGYVYRVDVELVEKTREKMVKVHYRPKAVKLDNALETALPLPGNVEKDHYLIIIKSIKYICN